MRSVMTFNSITLDGYFAGPDGDMSFFHRSDDPEWNEFVSNNASGNALLVFGRKTYDIMVKFWPTPMAMELMPNVAKGMNSLPKIVFSRSLDSVDWNNATLHKGDPAEGILRLKKEDGPDLVILGSGSIVSQLARHGLIDTYQLVVWPVAIGAGKTLFEGIPEKLGLKLAGSRVFNNGNILLNYQLP